MSGLHGETDLHKTTSSNSTASSMIHAVLIFNNHGKSTHCSV
jgi:AP-3 complex subunit sigma